jgi:hypothetical protein
MTLRLEKWTERDEKVGKRSKVFIGVNQIIVGGLLFHRNCVLLKTRLAIVSIELIKYLRFDYLLCCLKIATFEAEKCLIYTSQRGWRKT